MEYKVKEMEGKPMEHLKPWRNELGSPMVVLTIDGGKGYDLSLRANDYDSLVRRKLLGRAVAISMKYRFLDEQNEVLRAFGATASTLDNKDSINSVFLKMSQRKTIDTVSVYSPQAGTEVAYWLGKIALRSNTSDQFSIAQDVFGSSNFIAAIGKYPHGWDSSAQVAYLLGFSLYRAADVNPETVFDILKTADTVASPEFVKTVGKYIKDSNQAATKEVINQLYMIAHTWPERDASEFAGFLGSPKVLSFVNKSKGHDTAIAVESVADAKSYLSMARTDLGSGELEDAIMNMAEKLIRRE